MTSLTENTKDTAEVEVVQDEGRRPVGMAGLLLGVVEQAIEDYHALRARLIVQGDQIIGIPDYKPDFVTDNQVHSLISFIRDGQMQDYLEMGEIKMHQDFIMRHLGIPTRS